MSDFMYDKRMIIPIIGAQIDLSEDQFNFGNGFYIVNKEFKIKTKFRIFKDRNDHNKISDSRLHNAEEATKWFKVIYKTKDYNKEGIDDDIEDKFHILNTLFHIVMVTPMYPTLVIIDFSKDGLSWKNVGIRNMSSEFFLASTQIKEEYVFQINQLDTVKQMFTILYDQFSKDFMGKNRIIRSISFYKHAVETYRQHLRFLNYTIAIESLLSTSKDELKYKIAQRAA